MLHAKTQETSPLADIALIYQLRRKLITSHCSTKNCCHPLFVFSSKNFHSVCALIFHCPGKRVAYARIVLVTPTSHARFAITALSYSVKYSYRPRDPDSFSDSSGSTLFFAACMLDEGIVSGPSGLDKTAFESSLLKYFNRAILNHLLRSSG
jgi:hypothetical protein